MEHSSVICRRTSDPEIVFIEDFCAYEFSVAVQVGMFDEMVSLIVCCALVIGNDPRLDLCLAQLAVSVLIVRVEVFGVDDFCFLVTIVVCKYMKITVM